MLEVHICFAFTIILDDSFNCIHHVIVISHSCILYKDMDFQSLSIGLFLSLSCFFFSFLFPLLSVRTQIGENIALIYHIIKVAILRCLDCDI